MHGCEAVTFYQVIFLFIHISDRQNGNLTLNNWRDFNPITGHFSFLLKKANKNKGLYSKFYFRITSF